MDKYSIEIKELEDSTGEVYVEIPPVLLEKLEWKEGDDLKFLPQENGSIIVKKVSMETVVLDLDDEELFKYMQAAHEKGMSLNEFIEDTIEGAIKLENE